MHSYHAVTVALMPLLGMSIASPMGSGIDGINVDSQLDRRQNLAWSNPAGGNLQVFFADDTVNFGTTNPTDLINAQVSQTCGTQGVCVQGQQDSGQATYIANGGVEYEEIGYTAEGQYPAGIHDAMIQVLAGIMNNQTAVSRACWNPRTQCVPGEPCDIHYGSECYTVYSGPRVLGVVYTDPALGPTATPGSMQIQWTITQQTSLGICSNLAAIGGALVSLIPDIGGAAAAAFSIAGTGCTDGNAQ